jgi:hypothetical protein
MNNKNWTKLCKGEIQAKQLEINFKEDIVSDDKSFEVKRKSDIKKDKKSGCKYDKKAY